MSVVPDTTVILKRLRGIADIFELGQQVVRERKPWGRGLDARHRFGRKRRELVVGDTNLYGFAHIPLAVGHARAGLTAKALDRSLPPSP